MVTKAKIKTISNDIVNTVRKEYKLPTRKDYNMRQCAYICAKFITNPKGEIHAKKVKSAAKYDGEYTKKIIGQKNYIKLAQKLVNYIEKNGKLPNHLSYGDLKIQTKVYTHAFASIVKYYFDKGKFPSEQKFYRSAFTKPKYRKYGRSTEYGCNNRGQNNGHYCGPHMIQEIIRNLTGKVISQSTLAEIIGTTYDGSDHEGLNTSIAWFNKKYGYNLKVEWKNFSEVGWSGIKKILESDNKDCGLHELYRNTWGHYTNFDRIYDDYIDVHNSLGDYCDYGCYCGYTEERDKSEAESYLGGISQKSVMVVTNETI